MGCINNKQLLGLSNNDINSVVMTNGPDWVIYSIKDKDAHYFTFTIFKN